MKKKVSIGERSFTLFNNTFLILLALICIVPFLNIIATSFASTQEVVAKKFILFPTTFSLDAYRYILSTFRLVLQVSERSSVCVQLH